MTTLYHATLFAVSTLCDAVHAALYVVLTKAADLTRLHDLRQYGGTRHC